MTQKLFFMEADIYPYFCYHLKWPRSINSLEIVKWWYSIILSRFITWINLQLMEMKLPHFYYLVTQWCHAYKKDKLTSWFQKPLIFDLLSLDAFSGLTAMKNEELSIHPSFCRIHPFLNHPIYIIFMLSGFIIIYSILWL